MSFLTANYEENKQSNYGALPTNEYEMVIGNAYEDATKNGAETLKIDLIVRNDLENAPALAETNGKYSNRYVFMDNWKRKATNQYDVESFQYILEAVGVPEGTRIESIDDFMNLIIGKPVLVYVKKEVDDYNTTDQNNPVYQNQVAPWNFKPSNFPQMAHKFKSKDDTSNNASNNGFESSGTTIEDDDLPF